MWSCGPTCVILFVWRMRMHTFNANVLLRPFVLLRAPRRVIHEVVRRRPHYGREHTTINVANGQLLLYLQLLLLRAAVRMMIWCPSALLQLRKDRILRLPKLQMEASLEKREVRLVKRVP